MARRENQRLLLLQIMDYLLENTDENNTVKMVDIQEHIDNELQYTLNRKTVYEYIHLLEEYGDSNKYNPQISRHRTKGYNVYKRLFNLTELQLLIDCVQSSKFVTYKKAKTITEKLKLLTSVHNRYTLERQNYVKNRIKNMNESIFNDINKFHSAIAGNQKISFRYFTYDLKKEKHYNKKGVHIVSPYALIWNDENYYLLAYDGRLTINYRVDKIESVKILDEKREGHDKFKNVNISERQTRIFSMFGGKEENVGLCFSNKLVGVAIDRFGKDISIRYYDEEHFAFNVTVQVSPQFYGWLCGLGNRVKILSPEWVVGKMNDHVNRIADLYKPSQIDVDNI